MDQERSTGQHGGDPSQTYDLFVSYAQADRAWVEGYLFDALEAAGATYISEAAFELGAPRLTEFERAVRQSRRTLLVVSDAYVTDAYGPFTDLLAQTFGVETGTWPVIPLILGDVSLPTRLNLLTGLDATEPELWETAIARLCETLDSPVPVEAPPPPCPYPGMVPFQERDSSRFFGRDQEVAEMLERLRLHPFLAVIGPSGTGKSSLVAAGLIPALAESGLFGSGEWMVRTFRPGAKPLDALEHVFGAPLDQPDAVVAALLDTEPEAERLLLICDQFEETFTVGRDQDRSFPAKLAEFADVTGCWVVLTVRADFYPDLMASPLWEQVKSHRLEVTPLGEDGLRDAIVRPAEDVGVHLGSVLVERLVAEAAGEPGVLPLVQETLVLLWEQLERRYLPVEAYEALAEGAGGGARSGLQAAMARRADHTLAGLSHTRQAIARRIFLRLVQFGEGRADTRRQQSASDLVSAGDDEEEFDTTLTTLVGHRLLTSSGAEGTAMARIDLAHEALITGWPVLLNWIGERRESEQTRRRLESKAAEWVRLGKGRSGLLDDVELAEAERWLTSEDATELGYDQNLPELVAESRTALEEETTRRRRRVRTLVAGLAVGLIVVGGLAIWGITSARTAEIEAENARIAEAVAQSEAENARTAEATAEQRRVEAETLARTSLSRQLAVQATDVMERQLDRALLLAVQAYRTESTPEARSSLLTTIGFSPHLERRLSDGSGDAAVVLVAFAGEDRVISVDSEWQVRIWDSSTGEDGNVAMVLPAGLSILKDLAISEDRQMLVTVACTEEDSDGFCLTRVVRLWDTATMAETGTPIALEGDIVSAIALDPAKRHLAAATYSPDAIQIWDVVTGRRVGAPMPARVESMAFSPDGRLLASGVPVVSNATGESGVQVWDIATGDLVAETPIYPAGGTGVVEFSPDGGLIAAGHGNGTIRLLSSVDLEEQERFDAPFGVTTLTFTPNGITLLSGSSEDTDLRRWAFAPGERFLPRSYRGHNDFITDVDISPDGSKLVTGAADGEVILWNTRRPVLLEDVRRVHGTYVDELAWDDEGVIAAGRAPSSDTNLGDRQVTRWSMAGNGSSHPVIPLDGAVAFSPDGRRAAVGDDDGSVRLMDTATGTTIGAPITAHGGLVTSIAFGPEGTRLITTGCTSPADEFLNCAEDELGVWDIATGEATGGGSLGDETPSQVAMSPDGAIVALAQNGGEVGLWDLESDTMAARPLAGTTNLISDLAWSPDSSILAVAGYFGGNSVPTPSGQERNNVTLWDVATRTVIGEPLLGHAGGVQAVAFTPDGAVLASMDFNGEIRLWDVETQEQVGAPIQASSSGDSLAFNTDGTVLASGHSDGRVRLWDMDVASWMDKACRIANRNLSQGEWERFIGPDVPYQQTCPNLAAGE